MHSAHGDGDAVAPASTVRNELLVWSGSSVTVWERDDLHDGAFRWVGIADRTGSSHASERRGAMARGSFMRASAVTA